MINNYTRRGDHSPLFLIINIMKRDSLDIYDDMPEDMKHYLRYNGRHFNRKLCDFAISKMESINPSTGEVVELVKLDKEAIDALLKTYRIEIKNNQLYDYVYVANMCKADFFGRSVPDEQHLCLYIKDVIDDIDGYDGLVFNRWYADMCRTGIAIDRENML